MSGAVAALLVGEQDPKFPRDRRRWLVPRGDGGTGDRLLKLAGCSRREYLRRFARDNVLAPGRSAAAIVERARELRVLMVVLGRKAAREFWWWAEGDPTRRVGRPTYFVAYRASPAGAEEPRVFATLIPHPSGRCRSWNDPAVVLQAKALFGLLRAGAGREPG